MKIHHHLLKKQIPSYGILHQVKLNLKTLQYHSRKTGLEFEHLELIYDHFYNKLGCISEKMSNYIQRAHID